MGDLQCKTCGRKLPKTLARVPYVVVTANGAADTAGYTCGDCAYLAAHPDAKRLLAPPRVNRKHPQRESLLDPYDDLADTRSEARYADEGSEPTTDEVREAAFYPCSVDESAGMRDTLDVGK